MACPPAIRRLLVRPDNKEKVELFGPDEGLYGFRRWQHKRKAWRRASESNGFESYAGAVVEAAAQINWITRSLTEQNDWRLSYQLELLRGLTFHFDLHEAQRYGDYDHCSACSVQLAGHDWPAVQHEGYVTRYSIPNGSGGTHWKWICEQCFNDLYETMQWNLEPDTDS